MVSQSLSLKLLEYGIYFSSYPLSQHPKCVLYELLAQASSSCGSPFKLNEAIEIFAHCGVAADLEQYASQECDRCIYACQPIKEQNKSYEQVAAYFGVGGDFLGSDRTGDDIEASIESAASNLDISSNGIVSEVMRSKAKADASAAASMYLQHLSNNVWFSRVSIFLASDGISAQG